MLRVVSSFASRITADLLKLQSQVRDPERHLNEAVAWLERAHDASTDGGVSYGYSIRGGWRPSYRETSGYILTTFFNLAASRGSSTLRDRALRIGRWLVGVQNPDGSFSNPRYGSDGIVFDTGQDLFGLVRSYRETQDRVFLDAARRAANWLVQIADGEGRWTRNEHLGTPHVYNARSAWALLQFAALESHPEAERIARVNLDWAVSQQRNGYFDNCAFRKGDAPFTHTIAYTIRGLLESGFLLEDERYVQCAAGAAGAMLRHVRADGFIPGQVDPQGHEVGNYCCLTGNCQLAISWARLYERNGDQQLRAAATRALDYVMAHQDVETRDFNVRGAIKGSQPIWGRYAPLSYPNWATKFFVDAMMLRSKWNT